MDSVTILVHILLYFWPDPASTLPFAMLFACLATAAPRLGLAAVLGPAQPSMTSTESKSPVSSGLASCVLPGSV
jgi:hypothetical protein